MEQCTKPESCIQILTRLETKMTELVGNGQPGIIARHEQRLTRLERWLYLSIGGGTVIGFLLRGMLK